MLRFAQHDSAIFSHLQSPGKSGPHPLCSPSPARRGRGLREGAALRTHGSEGVKKSTSHVIPSEARNLHLFVFKEINADASLRSA